MATPKKKNPRIKSAVTGLTDTELVVAEAVLNGNTLTEAADLAGCTPQNASQVVKHSTDVKKYLEDHRSELRNAAQIQRGDIVAGMMEAIDMARLGADPSSMIKGWSEIGKILGLYAPEVKKVELTAGQKNIRSKFEIMSDEELLAIAEGQSNVIEGDFQTVQ